MRIPEPGSPPPEPPFAFELAVQADDLRANWRRCNMLANYLAEYVAYQFPHREWAENLISTVANEFLEAAVQVTAPGSDVTVTCRQREDALELDLAHALSPEISADYSAFLGQLRGGAVHQLYFAHLSDAERPTPAFNQLGLLMLVHDFGVGVAAEPGAAPGSIAVRITIPTGEIAA